MPSLALSGWAQTADALSDVLPDGSQKITYGDCVDVPAVFSRMREANAAPEVAVGWSLGGQLLVRAIAAGVVRPQRLVLLGAPWQLVADKRFVGGKPKAMVAGSRLALKAAQEKMLSEFQKEFLAYGDSNAAHIKAVAPQSLDLCPQNDWLRWYDELASFSCADLDFSGFPRTVVIHGEKDVVIPPANATAFAQAITGAELHMLPKCGHAPHWHDANFVRQVITGA